MTTLIVGGTRGIGSVVKQMFLDRGDRVYTASRSVDSESNHFTIRLPDISELDKNIKPNYLVFTHRYRGTDWDDDFDVTVFNNDDRAASLAVSDHRPVWAIFETSNTDDDGDATEVLPQSWGAFKRNRGK